MKESPKEWLRGTGQHSKQRRPESIWMLSERVCLMGEELDRFEFRCEHCQKVHSRGSWSIAHYDIDQAFTCDDCGGISIILCDPSRNITETKTVKGVKRQW